MADPQIIQCASDCTVTVVHELSLPLLSLSPAEGAQIAGAVAAIWTLAWGFRVLIQMVRSSTEIQSFNEEK